MTILLVYCCIHDAEHIAGTQQMQTIFFLQNGISEPDSLIKKYDFTRRSA